MTTGEAYDPWRDLARRTHLTLAFTRLPVGQGWYLHDVPGIVLDDRLTRVGARCALAHELAHIDLGHTHQMAGNGPGTSRIARRRETEADALADARLVPLERLVDALRWSQDEHELAELLWVTTDLIRRRLAGLTSDEHGIIEEGLWGRTA